MSSRRRPLALVVALAVSMLLLGVSRSADARERMGLAGGLILKSDGTLESGKVVLIKDGVIEGVTTPDDVPDTVPITTIPANAVIAPGMTAVNSQIGCFRQNIALSKVIDAAPSCKDAVDPMSPDLRRALEAGFTSAMALPAPSNIVCGAGVTYRTITGQALELLSESPLVFSLGRQVLRRDVEPTSRSSAVRLLNQCLADAGKGEGAVRIRDFVAGKIPGLLFCSEERDVRSAMRAFGDAGRIPDLVYTPSNRDQRQTELLAEGLAAGGVRVVMGPFDWNTPESTLRAAGTYSDKGVAITFASGLPQSDVSTARRSAALAVRYGMKPEAARRALTVVAAGVAGVGSRLGSIERGRDADLAIFSGDPLRPDTRILSVYVRGKLVVAAEAEAGSGAGQ